MKIMSFNTQHCQNYLKGEIDFQIMADAIIKCGADIVGLNEMYNKGDAEDFVAQAEILAGLTGLKHSYFAKAIDYEGNNPYGNAVLSRFAITAAETIMIADPEPQAYNGYYQTRCILKATLENGLTVLITHFGLNPDEQENAVATVLNNLKGEKCILMGDFNITPDNKVLAPIKEKMIDTADYFGCSLLSFPSDNPTEKIDYIYVSHDIKVLDADIPAIIASDHRPHTATVNIPEI